MNDNPYRPPSSRVDDRPAAPDIAKRPIQVTRAVTLVWLSLLVGLPLNLWQIEAVPDDEGRGFVLGTVLFFTLVAICLNVLISRGTNWARIVFLVLTLLALPAYAGLLDEETAVVSLSAINGFMDVVTIVLLFSKTSSRWFTGRL